MVVPITGCAQQTEVEFVGSDSEEGRLMKELVRLCFVAIEASGPVALVFSQRIH
jgi:hypothetical protein